MVILKENSLHPRKDQRKFLLVWGKKLFFKVEFLNNKVKQ